jgi:hypothetical protein
LTKKKSLRLELELLLIDVFEQEEHPQQDLLNLILLRGGGSMSVGEGKSSDKKDRHTCNLPPA